jgi:hypothetical protein
MRHRLWPPKVLCATCLRLGFRCLACKWTTNSDSHGVWVYWVDHSEAFANDRVHRTSVICNSICANVLWPANKVCISGWIWLVQREIEIFKEGSCFDEDKVEETHQRWTACIVACIHTFWQRTLDGGEEKDDIGKDRYLYITDTSRNALHGIY